MKYYNFDKAIALVMEAIPRGLEEAELCMIEDWFWTSETIWISGKFDWRSDEELIAGIDRSFWATPTLRLIFEDGSIEEHPCYFE